MKKRQSKKQKIQNLKNKLHSVTTVSFEDAEKQAKENYSLHVPASLDEIQDLPSKYAFIVETTTPFKLIKFQKEYFNTIERFLLCIIVASRQVGKTFGLALFIYAFMVIHPGCLIIIISTGEKHAKEILSRVRNVFRKSILKFDYEVDSQGEIKLAKTGSRVISLPANPKTVAGYTPDLVVVDECAKIENWAEMRGAIFPMVAQSAGKLVISSSFLGKNHFWEMAIDPIWNTKVYPWWTNPSKVIEFFRRILPPSQFEEEFNCIPVDEGYSLFPLELIAELTVDKLEEFYI